MRTEAGLPPRSLRGRLIAAFVLLGLVTWLGVGIALFLALRGLHAEATTAQLADVSVPLVARARTDLAAGMTAEATLGDLASQLEGTGVSIYLALADGRVVPVAGGPVPVSGLSIDPSLPQGSLDRGSFRAADGATYAWVASILRTGPRGSRAVVAATPDRAGADALRDLLSTLPIVILLTLAVGVGVASLVARSVTGPLRRLADATADVPRAEPVTPLPLEGPTEVRDLTVRFDRMRAEVVATREREARLLADLRHDLRTPLTVITGFADALRDGTAAGPDADRAAEAIAAEADRISDLVAGLGAIEELAGGRSLRPEPLDGAVLVAEAAARFAGAPAALGVELVTLPPVGDTTLVADRRAVERILTNLVENSLAALETASPGPDGARGHVWLAARVTATVGGEGDAVLLAVTDDGPGFAPGLAERAFDRFVRGDPARSGSGSGLGLAIVRELAMAHGGAVHAENVAPHGARISVVLPRVPGGRPSTDEA